VGFEPLIGRLNHDAAGLGPENQHRPDMGSGRCRNSTGMMQPLPADSGVLTPAATSQTAKPGTAALALASRWPDGLHASAVTRDRDVRNVMLASAEALLRVQRHRSACPGWHLGAGMGPFVSHPQQ